MAQSKGTSETIPPLIIHGFRKGPQLARQLLDAGFSISIGTHHHPDILSIIPPHRLYHETDEE
jgi:Tat protein secretion system quality control protein TatD with DNase activity